MLHYEPHYLGNLMRYRIRADRRHDGAVWQPPGKLTSMFLQAFSSRFAIGLLAANVSLRLHPALAGAIVGLLISLPDAFAMKSYVGILGTGLLFGAMAGWAANTWAP